MIDLEKLPVLPQRQDSVSDQLADLKLVANRLGMYDAADVISQLYKKLPPLKYGCHVDLDFDEGPDDCVIDIGNLDDCQYAKEGMRKEQCKYWKIVA